jgi:uncharacterized protein YdbL (DUF1318 family)
MRLSKKLLAYLCAVTVAYCSSVGIDVYRITTSDAFPLAKSALTGYLGSVNSKDASKPPYLKWWRYWYFKDGYSSGYANFLLCTSLKQCYTIKSQKKNGNWATNINGKWVTSTTENGKTVTNIDGKWVATTTENGKTVTNTDGKWVATTTENGKTVTNIDGKWFVLGDNQTEIAREKHAP